MGVQATILLAKLPQGDVGRKDADMSRWLTNGHESPACCTRVPSPPSRGRVWVRGPSLPDYCISPA